MTMRAAIAAMVIFSCACAGDDRWKHAPPKYAEVAEIHHAQCGNCHTRVEPGKRTRAQLEAALSKHHKRVKMSDEDWVLLVDYLSQTP